MSNTRNQEFSSKHQRLAWLTCFGTALFLFFDLVQMAAFNALNYELMHVFHLDASEISFISSLYFYFDVILLIPVGLLYDRFSTRSILLWGMTFIVLVTLWFAWFATPSSLITYRALTGAANGLAFIGLMRMISRWFPNKKAALVTGIMISFAVMGGVFANAPFAWLIEQYGWQQALVLNGYLGIGLLTLMILTIREPLSQHRTQDLSSGLSSFFHQLRKVVTYKQNWHIGLYAGFLNLPVPILATLWGVGYLTEAYGVSLTKAATISSLLFVGLIIGSPLFGKISDSMGKRKPVLLLGAICSLLVVLIIIYVPWLEVYSLSALFLLLGIFFSAHVVAFPAVTESNPLSISSTALSFVLLIFNLIAAVSQGLFGFILDLTWQGGMAEGIKHYTVSDYKIALLMLPILFIVSIYLAQKVKETHCQMSNDDYR